MQKNLSKKFIEQQKLKLESEKKKILSQIEELKRDDPFSDPDHANDNAAVDTDVREQVGHGTIQAQIKDLQKRFNDIEITLKRIMRQVYGQCERCNLPIPLARLKLIPEARFCVECENKLRK
jgi:RNA polymerase-binding transcription factor DksA